MKLKCIDIIYTQWFDVLYLLAVWHVTTKQIVTAPLHLSVKILSLLLMLHETVCKQVHRKWILVHFYVVLRTGCKSNAHDAKLKIEVILS